MPKIMVPTDPAGFQEFLSDSAKLAEVFSPAAAADGSMREWVTAYAREFVKNNPDTVVDLKDQINTMVQSAVFDAVRESNGGRSPKVTFSGGRPSLKMPDLTQNYNEVSRGRGTVYNKTSPGARLDNALTPEEQFGDIGEMLRAIRATGVPHSHPGERDALIAKLTRATQIQNSFGSEVPDAGGFLIPELMRSELFQLALESEIVRNYATVIPMSTLRVPIPYVDDTSHASSLFGGITFYWAEEGATLTESQAKFGRLVLDAKKLTGFFKVPNELLQDAPAFTSWFNQRIPAGLAWWEDLYFMRGTGVGEPLGFVSCPASVQVAKQSGQLTNTIVWENIVGMYARMLPSSLGKAVWVANIDTFPELATMALAVGTGGGPIWIGSYGGGGTNGTQTPPMTILGRPVIFTEKTPALTSTGDINFVDLSYYLIGDRQSVAVAASDQFAFQNDQTVYRIITRLDGQPWLQSALTPHSDSTNTLSPFVQIAAR
jgi:HK97 family phage major capsid protein